MTTPHETLLAQYADELSNAKRLAERWWAALLARETLARGGDAEAAQQALDARWRDGPASHPRVLAVIRKYWLACEALNQQQLAQQVAQEEQAEAHDFDPEQVEPSDEDEDTEYDEDEEEEDEEEEDEEEDDEGDEEDAEIYPHLFIHEWLLDDHEELFIFLKNLTYWPVGLDANHDFT